MYACNGIYLIMSLPMRRDFRNAEDYSWFEQYRHGFRALSLHGNIDSCATGATRRLRPHAMDDAQQDEPEDFVIATGVQYSVRERISGQRTA